MAGSPKAAPPSQRVLYQLPLLPLRDIVIYPHMILPLFVGRPKSIQALESAVAGNRQIALAAQIKAKTDDPKPEEIHRIGTVADIIQLLRLPDGTVKVLVEGKARARIDSYLPNEKYFEVMAERIKDQPEVTPEVEALMRNVLGQFEQYVKLHRRIPSEVLGSIQAVEEPGRLADTVAAHLAIKAEDRQAVLELLSPKDRLLRLTELLDAEIEILEIEKRIRGRVKKQMEKTQREYYLTEQLRAIQKELGKKDDHQAEVDDLEKQIKKAGMPPAIQEKALKELKRLEMMAPMSAEATVVRTYIDWLVSLPWAKRTRDKLDIRAAERILNEDHYGLEKVKERIVEYLAVRRLVKKMKGPILCFVGPPGVGKTSLARSIARALGRNFVRVSLGGVRDEAEIRGHRRTYIGALPGRIIQGIKRAASRNPVYLMDEVDKMSTDFRGDPSAALLEVLDPEQNSTFSDHYLEVDFDLSEVMFITTANVLHTIPPALQDRMEVIRIPGYTELEKVKIAQQFLVPKQLRAHGLDEKRVVFSENAIKRIIRQYTREAGVRNLERELANLCRKVARKVVSGGKGTEIRLSAARVPDYLGVPRFRQEELEAESQVGLAHGLAWTEVGGELLAIEATVMDGKGRLVLTGMLGDVMQESGRAALSYIRSRAKELGLAPEFYRRKEIHIHVPEGAIPKDGPSAGITMATALASALTGRPVRREVAMTGEITLRGRVLPIGGLKEKLLAAHRVGIKTVIVPREAEKDLRDVPPLIRKGLKVVLVEHMDQVLKMALEEEQVPRKPVPSGPAYSELPSSGALACSEVSS